MSELHRQRLRRYKFEFWFVGNDRRPSQKSGMRRGKIGTLPILQICPRPSRIIGKISTIDFEFSLVGKILDSRETVKSTIVWDFPDIWKPGLTARPVYSTQYHFVISSVEGPRLKGCWYVESKLVEETGYESRQTSKLKARVL